MKKREEELSFIERFKLMLYGYFLEYAGWDCKIDGLVIIVGTIMFPFWVIYKILVFIFTKIVFPIILYIPNKIAKWIS